MASNRNTTIDEVKGICLLHMLLLHLLIIHGTIDFTGTGAGLYFHLMEFFMIPFYIFSGFFFSNKRGFKEFISHKARRLLVPLLFWSAISLPFYYLFQYYTHGFVQWEQPFPLFFTIGSLSSNDALWFLFSLFFVNVIFYFVSTKLKNERLLLLFVIACFIYACIDRYYLPCFFSSSNISLGIVYFFIGYKLKTTQFNFLHWKYLLLPVVLFISISFFDPQWMQIVTLYQPEGFFTLNLVYALSGTYILWFVFSRLPHIKLLSYFGSNSMCFYFWHMIPLRLIFDPIIKNYMPHISSVQYALMGGGIILVTGWLIDRYASRYCPILIGK